MPSKNAKKLSPGMHPICLQFCKGNDDYYSLLQVKPEHIFHICCKTRNHRTEVRRDLWRSLSPTLCSNKVSYSRLPRTVANQVSLSPGTETPHLHRVTYSNIQPPSQKNSSHVQTEFARCQLVPSVSCPVIGHH